MPSSVVRASSASSVRSVARARVSDRNDSATVVRTTARPAARRASDRAPGERPTVDLTERAPASPPAPTDDLGEEELLFSDLERKEARLRWDQIEDLTRLAKRLNRARRGQPGRRITENTLIRVALDYLLEHQRDLTGRTESELLDELREAR